jgi:hypothetical protein
LPAALPINSYLNDTAVHDTVSLLPIWRWRDHIFSPGSIDEVVVGAAILGALVVALIPLRFAVLLPVAVLLYYAAATRPVEARIRQASNGAWEAGARPVYDWVDRGVGADADVAQVWTGGGNHFSFWESEFYNRSVGPVYALSQPFDAFGQRMASTKADGRVEYLGRPLRLRFALTDIWTKLRGEVVVRNELTGMAAYRVDGPLVVVEHLQGLYPDRWTGPYAVYRRYDCAGGSLLLDFETNPVLHPKRFAVSVSQNGVAAGQLPVPARPADKVLSIPLRPRGGFCEISLGIPTASATRETPGDLRQLGLRIRSIRYVRSR